MRRRRRGGLGDAAAAGGGGKGIRLVQMKDEAQHFHTVKKRKKRMPTRSCAGVWRRCLGSTVLILMQISLLLFLKMLYVM